MEPADQPDQPNDGDLPVGSVAQPDDDSDLIAQHAAGDEKQKGILKDLLSARRTSRETKAELARIKGEYERLTQNVQTMQPLLETIQRLTPQQREALATGRLPSPAGTEQDAGDVEAMELAQDLGLIAADGSLDIARARKRLDKDNERFARLLDQHVAPLRQTTHQQIASNIRTQAKAQVDAAGNPLASPESIDEAYSMLPPELAANPQVAMVAIGTAMLIDKMKGRTAKAPQTSIYGDPIYSEPAGGRRGAQVSAEDRAMAKKAGLTDADITAAAAALAQSAGRRGIDME